MQTSICRMGNNKVLLYSTGTYTQYPVIKHNGKEYKKVYIYIYIHTHTYTYTYIYITELVFCTAEINIVNQPDLSKIKKKKN